MSNREKDIKALLDRAQKDINKIEAEYNTSLHNKSITDDLKINIKNFCENLRSVLDYLAGGIRQIHCPTAKGKGKFYFPILPNRDRFTAKMTEWFPGLEKACPELWNYLESIQLYNGNHWLGHFNRLNIENKHECLVEQTRTETKEIKVTLGGKGEHSGIAETETMGTPRAAISIDGKKGEVRWTPDYLRIRPGGGVSVNGKQIIDPNTRQAIPHPSDKVEHIKWVDFRFDGIPVSALDLLTQSLYGTRTIARKIRDWL